WSDSWKFASYIIGFLLALLPLALFKINKLKDSWHFVILPLGIIAFLPLFIVAVDWGRWIFFYIASMSFLLIALRLFNHARIRWDVPGLLLFFYCTSWFISHSSRGLKVLLWEIGRFPT
ncbi:MAG: hypothetical protein PVF65_11595, partial [Sphingomonadales bacterium]